MQNKEIFLDLARETSQRFGNLPPDFAKTMWRRLQRKFKVKVSADEIAALTNSYADIYRLAALTLKECILPHADEYASLSHIDDQKFMSTIQAQFPAEDPEILREIAHWVIQYEYLR